MTCFDRFFSDPDANHIFAEVGTFNVAQAHAIFCQLSSAVWDVGYAIPLSFFDVGIQGIPAINACREPLWQGLQAIMQQPWGVATMLDLYGGLLIFGTWIALTEPRRSLIPLWWVLLLLFGNMVSLAYLLRRSFIARDLRTAIFGERR